MPGLTDDQWKDLLEQIGDGKVIPIIGEGAVTVADPDRPGKILPLTHWLANRLAANLNVALSPDLPQPHTLHQVVATYLMGGRRRRGTVYSRIKQLLEANPFPPSPALEALAGISHFNLFLTTAFDSLLNDALNSVRYGGTPLTRRVIFHPGAEEKDLPARMKNLETTLFHLLGRVSNQPNFAAWDEDVMEFILALHRFLERDQDPAKAPYLAGALRDCHLLLIGSNFDDWPVRFLLRVAGQNRLSAISEINHIVADDTPPINQSLVLFFDGVRGDPRDPQVFGIDPVSFALELRTRWNERFPAEAAASQQRWRSAGLAPFERPTPVMPRGSVFLSYAREDIEVAKRLKTALAEAGLPVWYDVERLQAGENWANTLEIEVKERASLFISIISKKTERDPGYYHIERKWAIEPAEKQGAQGGFYLPVIIDDTPVGALTRETPLWRNANVTVLSGGAPTPEFVSRVKELYKSHTQGGES